MENLSLQYLEKLTRVSENFGPISVEISEAFWMSLEVSESRICHFFFPVGLQESNFSKFVATAYRTEL